MSALPVSRPHAPIFRPRPVVVVFAQLPDAPPVVAPSRVLRPIGIYVARRESFEVTAAVALTPVCIVSAAFDELPLAENGWRTETTQADHLGDTRWRLTRGAP